MARMKDIRTAAEEEIRLEDYRAAVDKEKARIRARKPFWHRVFPWKIIIIKR